MSEVSTILIGVTGGIGSGKSVVCRICALRGLPVYDCDSRAKALMHESEELRISLLELLGKDAYCTDGSVNTACVAQRIFADIEVRRSVEALVHEAVRRDLKHWLLSVDGKVAVVESAILHTSMLDKLADRIWLVDAPESVRLSRVRQRSALTDEQILARMACQQSEFDSLPSEKVSLITNDGDVSLLARIDYLLKSMK